MIKQYETSMYSGYQQEKLIQSDQKSDFSLSLDKNKTYQEVLGFGGAFTEAAAYTFSKMTPYSQEKIIKAYFHPTEGLNYNLGRVAIHSCDFALENYTYVNDHDKSLESFSIERDHQWVIPMVKQAESMRGESIELLASPWSPPAWMKTNNDMNHGGELLPEYYETWAKYYVKFLDAYKEAGINVFALTVQNEPAAKQVWDSCLYTAAQERDFVKNHLGPTLHKHGYKDIKLLIWDHNRDIIVERAKTVLEDPEAAKYVWGTGVHWYVSEAFENLSKVHDMFPDKHLLFTEGTIEGGVALKDFKTGERYMRNMIGDFSNYLEGFLDWNLILDEQGGPNHVGNYCDAPIICDTKNDIVHINTSYYAIGHFSQFLEVGAKRIKSQMTHPYVTNVAFVNPNGDVVVILQNETDNDTDLTVKLGKTTQTIHMNKRSYSTLIIRGEA